MVDRDADLPSVLPVIETQRLRLRPFEISDAKDVQRLAGDRAVADTTLNIPHPYDDGEAEIWISGHRDLFKKWEHAIFAIALRETGELVGAMGLHLNPRFNRAELGYWIGKPYWNNGYCTEAARRVVQFGFEDLLLNRIHAHHMSRNPASGRVMEHIGMRLEGTMRQHVRKWDKYEDIVCYAILREDWEREGSGPGKQGAT
jgi:RimJ/RimL family protein N-acetyltransferase